MKYLQWEDTAIEAHTVTFRCRIETCNIIQMQKKTLLKTPIGLSSKKKKKNRTNVNFEEKMYKQQKFDFYQNYSLYLYIWYAFVN